MRTRIKFIRFLPQVKADEVYFQTILSLVGVFSGLAKPRQKQQPKSFTWENRMEQLIKLGGFYNLAFAIFHILFWKIFKWNSVLPKLDFLNRAIMQVLNLCLIFCFILFSWISLFFARELLTSDLGRTLLAGISIFWFLRSIEQIIFFNIRRVESILFLIVFLCGSFIYALPLFL